MDNNKEIPYQLRSRGSSKRKIHTCSSRPNDSRNTKRPAPAEEQIRVLNKKIKDLEEELLRVKQELHQAHSKLEKMDESQQEVEKQTKEHTFNFRDEIVMNIFKFMNYNELCHASTICKDWQRISNHSDFTKKIFVNWKTPEKVLKCIEGLPSCTTHIVQAGVVDNVKLDIDMNVFLMKIQQRCPNLHTLILNRLSFNVAGEIFNLFIQLPETVQVFVLDDSDIFGKLLPNYVNTDQISMIRVLSLSNCNRVFIRPFSFSSMPFLKHLRLAGCAMAHGDLGFENIPGFFRQDYFFDSMVKMLCQQLTIIDLEMSGIRSATFRTIFSSCNQLEEVYVCFSTVKDSDLTFIANGKIVSTRLEKICLRNSLVTSVGINALILAIPSLTDVYVGSKGSNCANNYSDCLSEKVHVINDIKHCKHHKKVNYLCV